MTDQNAPANEYGCPWHALHGNRHDEHYWAYIRAVVVPMIARTSDNMA